MVAESSFVKATVDFVLKRLPVWLVLLTVLLVLGWYIALTAIALLTNRSVDFFPPRIGTDRALSDQVQLLASKMDDLDKHEQDYRHQLLQAVVKARERAVFESSLLLNVSGQLEAKESLSKAEADLAEENAKVLKQLQELKSEIQKLSTKL